MLEVSVIMAVYNTENSIVKAAIESILNQSIKELELLICDDGSTDDTYSILEEISKKDERVVLLRNHKNNGVSSARNKCLSMAKAEFVAIMDADDYSDETRLEKQIGFLNNHSKFDFVGTAGKYFNDSGNNMGEYWLCELPQKKDFLFAMPFIHASLVFRKHVLLAVNGYRDDCEVTRCEDYDLLMRLYSKGYCGANIREVLYYIRLDDAAFNRRKYRYRLNECIVKYKGFKRLGLMPKGVLYAVKPLIVGLIPVRILNAMKIKFYKSKR